MASTMESISVGSALETLAAHGISSEHTKGVPTLTVSAATIQNDSESETHMEMSIMAIIFWKDSWFIQLYSTSIFLVPRNRFLMFLRTSAPPSTRDSLMWNNRRLS